MPEALIFSSTNPQYDNRLFIELHVQYMKIPSSNLGKTCCVQKLFLTFRMIFVLNMFSQCSAKGRASDKDLPLTEMPLGFQIWVGKQKCGRHNLPLLVEKNDFFSKLNVFICNWHENKCSKLRSYLHRYK